MGVSQEYLDGRQKTEVKKEAFLALPLCPWPPAIRPKSEAGSRKPEDRSQKMNSDS